MDPLCGADVLAVFVKEPRPGAVKSRLAARIGPERAAAVYRAIAEEALRRTAPRGDEYSRLLFFTPPQARTAVEQWLPGPVLLPQVEGELGERMSSALSEIFGRGARRAAVVGTDVPRLSREDVRQAFEGLDAHDLVLGPATDGGYYLLALKRPEPALFRGIPWSTPAVLTTTLERAAQSGRSVWLLRTLGDVDTAEDLAADWTRIAPILPRPLAAELRGLLGLAGSA